MKNDVSIADLQKLDDAFKRLGVQGEVRLGGKIIKLGLSQTLQSPAERASTKKPGPKPKAKSTEKKTDEAGKVELGVAQ